MGIENGLTNVRLVYTHMSHVELPMVHCVPWLASGPDNRHVHVLGRDSTTWNKRSIWTVTVNSPNDPL